MAKQKYDVDPELLREFLDESIDELTPIESWFLELGLDPENIDIVNKIFRPIHSLKGNSPFFGLLKTKELAHKMEDLLDLVRRKNKAVSKELIDKLLAGVDQLRSILEAVRDGNVEVDDEDAYNEILNAVVECTVDEFQLQDFLKDIETKMIPLREFIEEGKESYLDEVVSLIHTYMEKSDEKPTAENVPESVLTVLDILEEPFEEYLNDVDSERILEYLKNMQDTFTIDEAKDIVSATIDEYSTFVEAIGFDPLLREMIIEKMQLLTKIEFPGEINPDVVEGSDKALEQLTVEPTEEDEEDVDENVVAEKTMRVSEKSIDAFLEFVGELLVVQEMFNFFGKTISSSNLSRESMAEFRRILETFDLLSEGLRKSILEIRTLPVKRVFQKVPRLVYEVADKTGKKVKVELVGEDLLIDKSYIEILDAPIVHMVRNSIDHGIEAAEERLAAGKPDTGHITISAVETSANILLVIEDDGGGINYDAVRNKAVEIGLIDEGQPLTDEKLVDLLFESGVSTASEVTDISGRGVGMDVVKRNIESLGGSISITSMSGLGTKNTITLPRNITTQIVDGFLVQVQNETYILPMLAVFESYSPLDAEISTVTGKGTIVKRHGNLQTYISMAKLMELDDAVLDLADGIIVSVNMHGVLYALAVDQILGVQKVVVKSIDDALIQGNLFSGAALMGDGSVAMVIDMEALNKHALK